MFRPAEAEKSRRLLQLSQRKGFGTNLHEFRCPQTNLTKRLSETLIATSARRLQGDSKTATTTFGLGWRMRFRAGSALSEKRRA